MAPIDSQSEAVFITNYVRQQPTHHRQDLRILGLLLHPLRFVICPEHIMNIMFFSFRAMEMPVRCQGEQNE